MKFFRNLLFRALGIEWWEVYPMSWEWSETRRNIPNYFRISKLRKSKITDRWQVYKFHIFASWKPRWEDVSEEYIAKLIAGKLKS